MPIRVELKPLTEQDMYTILTEPENNLVKQQCALMFTEGVQARLPRPASAARATLPAVNPPPPPQLEITDDAKWRMAKLASEINRDVENIGARRLHTIMERLTEDLSFSATERAGEKIEFNAETVQNSVGELAKKADLKRFVL